MKRRHLSTLLVLFSLLAGGCTTTGPTYQYTKKSDSAVLIGRNFMVFIPNDKVRISFVEIDGDLVKPSAWSGPPEEVPIAPGQHTITFGLEGFQFVLAQDTTVLNVEAGHRYKFKARKVGIAFDVEVVDETSARTVLAKRVDGTKSAGPAYVPIFIPIR